MKTSDYKCFVLLLVLATLSEIATAAPAPSPVFYKTQSSDEWVKRTFHLQNKYTRVLLVDQSASPPRTLRVSTVDLNLKKDRTKPGLSYIVSKVFKTLQEAADFSKGGNLVAVMPGMYAGFVIGDKSDAGDRRYIHFKAIGAPGDVVIDRPSDRDPDSMVYSRPAHINRRGL